MNGFDKYASFFRRDPSLVVEWHDDKTDACGWLCIDSLRGGAAGGGTRMTHLGTREEAVFLAKTMGIKFQVCGPNIGGGKSVLRFDARAHPKDKRGVLERWYRHIGPYLKNCYGTGGDVNVDEVSEATAITSAVVGIGHPQEGICRGHDWKDKEAVKAKVARVRHGCEAMVSIPELPGPRDGQWMIADVVTGYGVARSVQTYYEVRGLELAGQRVIVEGLGAVGAFAAYYLEKLGAVLVAASTRDAGGKGVAVALNAEGFNAAELINSRRGTELVAGGKSGKKHNIIASKSGKELFSIEADIFVPAARSHTIDAQRLKQLRKAGVKVWSCGANNPFAYGEHKKPTVAKWVKDMLSLQREADKKFAIIPDFVANCGMARTFGYLMKAGAKPDADSILADAGKTIDGALRRLLDGHKKPAGLLGRGYEVFVP